MHKIVHLFFAARIAHQMSAFTGVSLCRLRFAFGNIQPDLTMSMCVAPHTARGSFDILCRRVDDLYQRQMHITEFSTKLGIAMHYVCDYFCHAHGESFSGSLLHHMLYELRMIRVLAKLPTELNDANSECLRAFSPAALCAYVRDEAVFHARQLPSPRSDVQQALQISRLFCQHALDRWCAQCLEPALAFEYAEAESAAIC